MTTEVAIINPQGIALAADSAVTTSKEQVWVHANKLFSLSPFNDIGIMIYGSASFIGHPWETIIKCYRKEIGNKKFNTVSECTENFLKFLHSAELSDKENETNSILSVCISLINLTIKNLKTTSTIHLKQEGNTKIERAIYILEEQLLTETICFGFSKNNFIEQSTINNLFKIYLKSNFGEEIAVSDAIYQRFFDLCLEVCNRRLPSDFMTGVVIAGFGEKEYLPVLNTYVIDGKYDGILRAWANLDKSHASNNNQNRVSILPFAQSDIINLFLEGISKSNSNFIWGFLKDSLEGISRSIVKNHIKDPEKQSIAFDEIKETTQEAMMSFFHSFQLHKKNSIDQIKQVLYTLPREEMAIMAEALVDLTTLYRKLDSNVQSVGGPTDVALISKGDGFVWIKRKHYFDIKLNPDFTKRKTVFKSEINNEA